MIEGRWGDWWSKMLYDCWASLFHTTRAQSSFSAQGSSETLVCSPSLRRGRWAISDDPLRTAPSGVILADLIWRWASVKLAWDPSSCRRLSGNAFEYPRSDMSDLAGLSSSRLRPSLMASGSAERSRPYRTAYFRNFPSLLNPNELTACSKTIPFALAP